MKFEIVRIDRRVDDSVSPTGVVLNPPKPATKVAVRSTSVLATGSNRLDVAQRALESVAVEQGPSPAAGTLFPRSLGAFGPQGPTLGAFGQPIPVALRQAALQQVDQDLVKQGLLDKVGGQVSPAAKPGLLVKGCLDDCDICEPELKRLMDLEATRKDLENQLLKKQIDLLEKSQEYRCCPAGEAEEP